MKQILLILVILSGACHFGEAQETREHGVPASVLKAFQQRFPKARVVEWEQHNNGNFEAEFIVGFSGRDQKVILSPDGRLLRHEEELSTSMLPDVVRGRIREQFSGYRISDAKRITFGEDTFYEVELEGRRHDLKVDFASDGAILRERMD